jgi:hypothetical protein
VQRVRRGAEILDLRDRAERGQRIERQARG